jgi:hypothetical protein
MPLNLPKNRGVIIAGAGSLVAVGTYLFIKHEKSKAANSAAAGSAAGSAASASGYGYGYGYAYGYGEVTPYPYPNADEYGYGAYGYGLYNPSTGAYVGAVGGGYPSTVTQTTNAEWTQAALSALEAQGVAGTTALAALGMYLAGQPVSASNAQIVQQAIALEGYPPQQGPNGYPPAIQQQQSTGQTGTTPAGGSTTSAPKAATGLRVTGASKTSLSYTWTGVPGAQFYDTYATYQGARIGYQRITTAKRTISGLGANRTYTLHVIAGNSHGTSSDAQTTHKTSA